MIILCYHKINNTKLFEQQVQYLSKNYQILSAATFFKKIEQGAEFSKKEMLITFDDGDMSLYTNALPVLKKYKVPAIAFVITSLLNTHQPFWWDEIEYYTGSSEEVRRVKKIPEAERVAFLQELRAASPKQKFIYPQLGKTQLQELEAGGIAIASHTHTHPLLNQCNPDQVLEELKTSATVLQQMQLPHWQFFAYPNGNVTDAVKEAVKAAGYKAAFVFDHFKAKQITDPFGISRLSVTDDTPMWKLKLILSGVHSVLVKYRKQWGI
jgi:peptidoglycan/xylan/chitin deacetylase (PgdA/CDA1 family)